MDRLTIDGHLLPVLVETRVRNGLRNRHPGVRHEDVEFPKLLHYFTDRLFDLCGVRDFDFIAATTLVH